jgi:small subunit ribosomal protein S7
MLDGKKAVAQRVVYDAIDKIQARIDKDKREGMPEKAIDAFRQAIDNVKPNVEVRSKRVGGANYQVPMPVTQRRRQNLAFRWIITAIRSEKGKPLSTRLAKELYDAANGEGKACTVREQTHRMAEANKAFSHFAW